MKPIGSEFSDEWRDFGELFDHEYFPLFLSQFRFQFNLKPFKISE